MQYKYEDMSCKNINKCNPSIERIKCTNQVKSVVNFHILHRNSYGNLSSTCLVNEEAKIPLLYLKKHFK